MNEVQILNKFRAPGNIPQGLSGVEMALWMILVEKGEKRLYGIPVLDALETGAMKSFIAVKLRDENGKEITNAEPISVACLPSGSMPNWWTYSGTIYVGFIDKKIRTYNIDMTPKVAYGTSYYYSLSQLPDGLYYDGTTLYYCSAGPDAIFSINTSTGVETREKVTVSGVDFDVISRRLSLNGVNTDSAGSGDTTRRYSQDSVGLFSPTAISANFLCSASLNKIAKRKTSIGQNFIDTIPSNAPIWTNEQTTPVQVFGITEVSDYSVAEDIVIYLSGGDGNIYKVRFEDKVATDSVGTGIWKARYDLNDAGGSSYGDDGTDGTYSYATGRQAASSDDPAENYRVQRTLRTYLKRTISSIPIDAYVVAYGSFTRYRIRWNGTTWTTETNTVDPVSTLLYTVPTFNENWDLANGDMYNNPVLGSLLVTVSYSGADSSGSGARTETGLTLSTKKVSLSSTTLYFAERYSNESQDVGVTVGPITQTLDFVKQGACYNTLVFSIAQLTDNGSLTVLDQFTGKSNQKGIHIGYKIPYIKIDGQSKDGYLKKSGTTYTTVVASTPTVTINGGSAVKYVGTRLTGGNYEIYRSYLSFDTKFIDFTPGVVHLYLKTVTLTVRDMEILVYEMSAHDVLTADKWGSVGRLLATKHVCAYHSIYLPLDVDLTNGIYVELRGSQEGSNSYIQNDLVTISAYELRIFS